MQLMVFALILVSVLLSSSSQILIKLGVSSPVVQQAMTTNTGITSVAATLALNPLVVAGIGCFGLSAIFWIFVLSKIDVSLAYPCVALGVVVTVLSGYFLLGEPVSILRAVGVGVIVVGVFTVAMG